MKHLSLFSGIGGLDLAAEWAGFETVAFVERDPYCQRVLAKRWPGVRIFSDVRAVAVADADCGEPRPVGGGAGEVPGVPQGQRGAELGADLFGRGGAPITLVSGGFPCQPHSVAGKRQASADERDLWPEFARVIREIRPRWVVAENVPGLLHSESGRFFGSILGDLADLGYSAGWGVWGAADVGALHRRERVFIVAYAGREGCATGGIRGGEAALGEILDAGIADGGQNEQWGGIAKRGTGSQSAGPPHHAREDVAHADLAGPQGHRRLRERASEWLAWKGDRPLEGIWESEPSVGRVASRIPARVDRLRALGNAVVPQQAFVLFKAIAEIEMKNTAGESSE